MSEKFTALPITNKSIPSAGYDQAWRQNQSSFVGFGYSPEKTDAFLPREIRPCPDWPSVPFLRLTLPGLRQRLTERAARGSVTEPTVSPRNMLWEGTHGGLSCPQPGASRNSEAGAHAGPLRNETTERKRPPPVGSGLNTTSGPVKIRVRLRGGCKSSRPAGAAPSKKQGGNFPGQAPKSHL